MKQNIIDILLAAEKGFTYPAEDVQYQFEDRRTKPL